MNVSDKVERSFVHLRHLAGRQDLAASAMEVLKDLLDIIIQGSVNFPDHVNLLRPQKHH